MLQVLRQPLVWGVQGLGRGVGQGPCTLVQLTFHSIVQRTVQEVCRSSRIVTALVLRFFQGTVECNSFLSDAKT